MKWVGWLDSLFGRVLLVQVSVALMAALLMGVAALYQQSQALARATAPVWAEALRAPLGAARGLPRMQPVTTTLELLAGPPPEDAIRTRLFPRFRALADELRLHGVPVTEMRVSGYTGDAVTWLQLDHSGQVSWVGIRSALEGTDVRDRGSVGLILGALATLFAASWLSGRVARPLTELRLAMRRFADEGLLPKPASPKAPAELRDLAEQFVELAHQRQALDEQRRTMLAAISHDLRSPLGRIRMAAEFLPTDPALDVWRTTIVRNVQLADRLLGSFIELARAEEEPLHDRVDMAALARKIMEDEYDIATELPQCPVVLKPASELGLERAVRNLLDNARHHGAPPFELTLKVEGSLAMLTLRDHGPGVPAADLQAMLQPFVRGESSRQRPGTGLGLAIVQRTAERHGGTVQLENANPGLQATLLLPLARRS